MDVNIAFDGNTNSEWKMFCHAQSIKCTYVGGYNAADYHP